MKNIMHSIFVLYVLSAHGQDRKIYYILWAERSNIMKEFGAGLVTGAVIGSVAGIIMDKSGRKMHHGNSTFKSIGAMIDNMIK